MASAAQIATGKSHRAPNTTQTPGTSSVMDTRGAQDQGGVGEDAMDAEVGPHITLKSHKIYPLAHTHNIAFFERYFN